MQKQFKREQRYFVVKVKDAKEYLDAHQLEKLAEIADTISEGREKGGIPAVECVVVESDWPEYESTWRAIEDRVTGARPAQKAVAYLDLGVGGYVDVGTDLTDEALAALPKGRHMLGIVGTYGVDGYVPAQPSPSVPECPYLCGWRNLLKLAIEDGAYLARSINTDEPVTENARAVTMRIVLMLRDVLMAINNAAPEAKP